MPNEKARSLRTNRVATTIVLAVIDRVVVSTTTRSNTARTLSTPETHFHTQVMERYSVETKAYLKRARYAGMLLQSQLYEIS